MTITLHCDREHDCWTATSESYRALFGQATLPTAFTASASAADVLAEVQERNPSARVVLA